MIDKEITRRVFLKGACAGGASVLLAGGLARAQPAAREPNIIYILLDDAGYGDLGCYGQEKFATPNIDRMAAEGMTFTDHYAGSTVCAPSRCSLLTGLHTGHASIRDNKGLPPEGQWPLPAGAVTLPALLRSAGYATGAFGKWGLGGPGSTGDPLNQGFDEFFGYISQLRAHTYYPDYLWHNNEKVMLDGKTYSHDLIVGKAFEFIRAHSGGPFFCYLPVAIPHAALHAPEESVRPFRKKFAKFETKLGIYADPVITNPPAHFAAMMTRLDAQIGELFELLKELGIDGETIVMLSSDNGPHEEGGAMPEFFKSSGPFRGIKRDLYEGGIRVPMLARWPGRIEAGSRTGHVSAFWDVLPTLCALAGAGPPGGVDGVSFAPTLLGRPGGQKAHEYLYWEFPSRGGVQAVRMGRWKAVRAGVSENPEAPVELYDLESDPGETTDVAARFPDVVSRVEAILKTARTESETFRLFN